MADTSADLKAVALPLEAKQFRVTRRYRNLPGPVYERDRKAPILDQDRYNLVRELSTFVWTKDEGWVSERFGQEFPATWWDHLLHDHPFLQRVFGAPRMGRINLDMVVHARSLFPGLSDPVPGLGERVVKYSTEVKQV